MERKKKKLRPKEMKFLEFYAQNGDAADAYIAAGYKVKSREVARTCGSRLLRKIDGNMDYMEILETVGLTDRRVAEVMKDLIDHPDPKVRVQALNIATKVKGWQREFLDVDQGQEIIILRRRPEKIGAGHSREQFPDEQKQIEARKPIALLR
jgi:hypothetical protein